MVPNPRAIFVNFTHHCWRFRIVVFRDPICFCVLQLYEMHSAILVSYCVRIATLLVFSVRSMLVIVISSDSIFFGDPWPLVVFRCGLRPSADDASDSFSLLFCLRFFFRCSPFLFVSVEVFSPSIVLPFALSSLQYWR